MTQAGGPAAINGFLYQIVHHIGWLADVTLSGKLDGQVIKEASLILEPRNGGDARAEASGIYLVEQYKTRTDGTWALSDIESVLRDLRKSVPTSRPANACYRFVTDGRAGRLHAFMAFLADVKSVSGPDELDNVERKKFKADINRTNREFFDYITTATRSTHRQANVEEQAVVFHLLSRFEMEFASYVDTRAAAVERLLRRYAPDLGQESRIREHLVGVLVEKLSKGEARLDINALDALFRHVGLSPERLRNLAVLPETMGALTHRRLKRLKYQPSRDVRSVPEWPEDKPVLLIAGDSGAGKTWQLGRLLEAYEQAREISTLVPAAKTVEELLSHAARDVWQTGLGETSNKTLVAVVHFLRELEPGATVSRTIVAYDDAQDVDLVRGLVRQDWVDWSMRLVLTVPRAVAGALQLTDGDTIHVHTVGEFSVDELDMLLNQCGRRWADLPQDLKKLLRHPVLAGLFLELPYVSVQSAPRSEYEIFEGFWQRIAAKGRAGDEGVVVALANYVCEGESYPLARTRWLEVGLDSQETLGRLEASGWLRSTENGEVLFAHDRLLNWAVAKSLVHRFLSKHLLTEELGAFLVGKSEGQDRRMFSRLGYVPMDALWMLAADTQNATALGQLVEIMEDSQEFGSYGKDLYVHLLPTLGQRAVPILLDRLSTITTGTDGDYRVRLIGQAFASLVRQESVDLKEVIDLLQNSPSPDYQDVAIEVLTEAPDAGRLNRLWELHQQRFSALEDKTDNSRYSDYNASFGALRAGIVLDSEWLRNRILAADAEKEPVSELAYLLNGLESGDARSIWRETRDTLMAKVSVGKPRSLLYCIARFDDCEKLDFVIQNLSRQEDFASGAALEVLSVLDPKAAIDHLVEVEDAERSITRNHWLPVLLRAQPDLTRKRIRELAEADPSGLRLIQELFWNRPDEIDEAMFHLVLRGLEKDLRECLDEAADPNKLYRPLGFIGRIARLDLLALLEMEVGSELESMIVTVACSRLQNNSRTRDHILENARRILILMGGEGISTLIRHELESKHYWVRHGGLNWAYVRADDGIIERLAAIARCPVSQDGNGQPESSHHLEFHQSMTVLAALGSDRVLVDILWQSGVASVPTNLAELRAHRGPMPKILTDQALRTLQSAEPTEDSLLIALVIAWLSDDTDMIPAVRVVLERNDLEGRAAAYACIALQVLGAPSDDFAQLAQRLLYTKSNSVWGLNALLRLGERGLELLGKWLEEKSERKHTDHNDLVIRALYDNPATRKLSVNAAVSHCEHGGRLDYPFDIAAEADEPGLREKILDKAFAARSFVPTQFLRAIEGLAKFDTMRAVEAIELGLHSHPKIEQQLCQLLVRMVPDTAATKLIDASVSIERESLRRAVGRALRRLNPNVVSRLVLERMSGLVPESKVVVELAGWLPVPAITEAMGNIADNDNASEVRHAALVSLERHRRETKIRALLDAFPPASPERQWSLLVAILNAADPYLLTEPEDPLWLGTILSENVPAVFAHHANSVLRQRKQKSE